MIAISRSDLLNAHKAGLGASTKKFAAAEDADLQRHIDKALAAFSRIRRRTLVHTLQLVANQADYPVPDDLLAPKVSRWGQGQLQPWQPGYGPLPKHSMYELDGEVFLNLHPAPTQSQINCFGSQYPLFYLAMHELKDEPEVSTIRESDKDLFLLLALIEAMKELVASGVTEPVSLSRGMGAVNSNSTPTAALEALTQQLDKIR